MQNKVLITQPRSENFQFQTENVAHPTTFKYIKFSFHSNNG